MSRRYWLETLGCPKNQVDSDKLAGTLVASGYQPASSVAEADLVVVNTCAFIDAARQESIDTILSLSDERAPGAELVVTGCLAERHGDELAAALPEVDRVAPFGYPLAGDHGTVGDGHPPAAVEDAVGGGIGLGAGGSARGVPVRLGPTRSAPSFDLLNLPRPPATAPWAYVKVAEGCDRACGFCAIPSFRGSQRSRGRDEILAEVDALESGGVPLGEVVLVAQDLASYGIDRRASEGASSGASVDRAGGPRTGANRPIVDLVRAVSARVPRVRLLYLYPSSLDDALVEAILDTGVPYFDLSLQHVSRPLLASMRRWGEGDRFLDRIAEIRAAAPGAAFRSSFIVGYPGETEEDHDLLLSWLEAAQLDWVGFFPYSREEGTHAATLGPAVPDTLVAERIDECTAMQDAITARRRDDLIGTEVEVLVDGPGVGRTYREAPEIDGVVRVPVDLDPGSFVTVRVEEAIGPDLIAADPARRPAGADPARRPSGADPDGRPSGPGDRRAGARAGRAAVAR